MYKNIFFVLIFSYSCLEAYILKLENLSKDEPQYFDVGANAEMTGLQIKQLLSRKISVPINKLIFFRPADYKPVEKTRLLKDTDVFYIINMKSQDPITYQFK